MAKVREYNFPTGFETSTIPDPGTPSADNDTISYGYLNNKSYWGASVANYTALKALTTAQRADNQVRHVDATPAELWKFDTNSAAADDGVTVLQPDDLPANGRWLLLSTGGGAGGGGAAGIEVLKHKAEMEHYDTVTPAIQNSVASGFGNSKQVVQPRLMRDHTSGSTIYLALNPLSLSSSDQDLNSITNFSVQNDAANLAADAGNKQIGTHSIMWDKTLGTNVRTAVRFDRTAVDLGVNGFSNLLTEFYLPTTSNFSVVGIRMDVDGTNWAEWTTNLDSSGATINGVQWWNVRFDLTTTPTATGGTSWDTSKLARYVWFFFDFSSAAQLANGFRIDSVMFGQRYPERLLRKGNELAIYDGSNLNYITIDHASSKCDGQVTLAASLTQAYSGGSGSSIRRQTAQIVGDNAARMEQGLSGAIADSQTVTLQTILGTAISSQVLEAFVNCNTNMFFEVSSVDSSTQIKVIDAADSTANLVNGKVLHVFKTHYNGDGQKFYEYRVLNLTISSSSHLSGITTITSSTNTGIEVGDIVILKVQDTKISLINASGANENFQTPTLDDILVTDLGLGYPYSDKLYAHWTLSGVDGYKNKNGSLGKDLTLAGSLTTNYQFLNGQLATGGWSDANYYSLTPSESTNLTGLSGGVDISFWFNATAFTGSGRVMFSRYNTGSLFGYYLWLASGSNTFQLAIDGSATIATMAFTPNQWNFVSLRLETSVATYFYLNAVKSSVYAGAFSNANSTFYIGRYTGAASSAAGVLMSDISINYNSVALSQGQIEAMYNRGLHRVLNHSAGIDYRYSISSMSGQVMTLKSTLDRTTDAALPFVGSAGVKQQ